MSTIVALSTPIGRGAIAIVRLSGPLSLEIARRLVPGLHDVKAREATWGKVRDPQTGEIIDEVLITFFSSPNSVTGEDVIEISCHGSPSVVRILLDSTLSMGARLADPGEFTLRSLANGKIDLAQAEAIRDLIAAQTSAAAKQATRQVSGELARTLRPFQDKLIKVIVLFESALEFVEDDLPTAELRTVQELLSSASKGIASLAETFVSGRLLHDGLKVAIVGSPNVGKSSLFNRLVDQDRAIVTEIPGTTRDTLTESIDVNGIPVLLTDTAGLRQSEDSIESLGIERTFRAMSEADLILNVVDASVELEPETSQTGDTVTILVMNKCDLPLAPRYKNRNDAIKVSAINGEGLDQLRAAILRKSIQGQQQEGLLITNARHHELLRAAAQEIDDALTLLSDRVGEELIVVPLHNALKYLGQITGETTSEDILSQIFSTFCIGK